MKLIELGKNPYTSLSFNLVYAVSNCTFGLFFHSLWFLIVSAYYVILALTRFCVLQIKNKADGNTDLEFFAEKTTGILLVILSFCLIGINILCAIKDRGIVFHEIIMIAIATYTFIKLSISIVGMIKARNQQLPIMKTLRNISFADAFFSIYTLQRSMLVSFPGMEPFEIQLFNILTGTVVWIIILFLGINLIGGKHVNMAKSKIVKITKKISDATVEGYNKVEKGVVSGYKAIEKGVVKAYTSIEDKFVDAYLTKDGESIEEAKKRLKKEK